MPNVREQRRHAKYAGMRRYDATNVPSGGTEQLNKRVETLKEEYPSQMSPKTPQTPGNENKKGVKIKDKTDVPRNPKMAGKTRKPNTPDRKSATEKRLLGKRI
jgi:hypothetical protein